MAFEQGPYLQTAVFCEKVLQEKDGVLSIIRIIDRLTHTAPGPSAPEMMPKFLYNMMAAIMLKSGSAIGPVQLKIEMEKPSGIKEVIGSQTLLMEGYERGQNFIMNLNIGFTEQGLYWFNILLEDIGTKQYHLLTRMPFRVIYIRMMGPQQPLL